MHPQHTDTAWAAGSLFGERIAHGMLVVSFALGLMPFDPDRVIALRGVKRRSVQAARGPGRHDPRRPAASIASTS